MHFDNTVAAGKNKERGEASSEAQRQCSYYAVRLLSHGRSAQPIEEWETRIGGEEEEEGWRCVGAVRAGG